MMAASVGQLKMQIFLQILAVFLLLLHTSHSQSKIKRKDGIYDKLGAYLLDPVAYNSKVMPICEVNKPLQVKQDMVLYQLFDLDEPTQQLMIDVWAETIWRDCRLTWNPADYQNVTEISLKSEDIWYPQLIFYQSLHGNFEEGLFIYAVSRARVRYDGMVQLGCQALLKSFCRIQIHQFPFDQQKCNVTFASWTNDATTIMLTSKTDPKKKSQVDDKKDHSFKEASNGEWEVTGFPAFNHISNRKVGIEENEEFPYAEVTFQLQLKRKFLFYQVYMIFPCALLSWVGALVFIMPIESGEKISYCTTIFLSLIVFLLVVADNIPRSGHGVPVLGVYFTLSISTVALSILMTVFVLNIGLKQKEICMPAWLARLTRGPLSRMVCFRAAHHGGQQKWLSFKVRRGPKEMTEETDAAAPATNAQPPANPAHSQSVNDWRMLAIVLDRVFLVLYLLLNFFSTIYVICQASN